MKPPKLGSTLTTPGFVDRLPRQTGIYCFHDGAGRILYIGKAKSIRTRILGHQRTRPEMVRKARRISWELHPSEARALAREHELLHAVRPPYNVADTEEGIYFFVGLDIGKARAPERIRLRFRLTDDPGRALDRPAAIFGCYKHRRKARLGYMALLRLIYAASSEKPRFSFPAKISGPAPAYDWRVDAPAIIEKDVVDFLSGRSARLLRRLTDLLLENEFIPRFVRASIQADLETARSFYRSGPSATRKLRKRCGTRAGALSHEEMDRLIAATLQNV